MMYGGGSSWYLGNVRVDANPPHNGQMNVHIFSHGHQHEFSLSLNGGGAIKLVNNDGGDCLKTISATSVESVIMT